MKEISIKEQVQIYRSLGVLAIPLRGKVAAYNWKDYKLNMRDFDRPGVNVGLRTTRLKCGLWFYVIDIDSKTIPEALLNVMPMGAPIVSTCKGFHCYFTWTSEVKTRHFPGVDVIGNGYVVAPSSAHASGKVYRFIRPLKGIPPLMDPASLDMWEEQPPTPLPWLSIPTGVSCTIASSRVCRKANGTTHLSDTSVLCTKPALQKKKLYRVYWLGM